MRKCQSVWWILLFVSFARTTTWARQNTQAEGSISSRSEAHVTRTFLSLNQPRSPQSLNSISDGWLGFEQPTECSTAEPDVVVRWLSSAAPPRCEPDVCGGATLPDLRDVDGKTTVAQICAGPLFDTKRTKECLNDKKVLFLGDSTLQESVIDIVSLLESLAYNDTSFFDFVEELNAYTYGETKPRYILSSGMEMQFFGGPKTRGRNFAVTSPASKMKLRFRFAGHYDVKGNMMGISSFFHHKMMNEFQCEFALARLDSIQCDLPHVLVVNSGQHDVKKSITRSYTSNLDRLLEMLGPHNLAAQGLIPRNHTNFDHITPYSVIWRGNTRGQYRTILEEMDNITQKRLLQYGIPFLNTSATMKGTLGFPECCSSQGLHLGSHEYDNYKKAKGSIMKFTASSMTTNELLRAVCAAPVKVNPNNTWLL